ncbi:MAG: CusA/CzcA family heavy metal efflux RND transporter [Bryobacterales bacterium]|nr:CusA/CzcA family heavy metal efflux RND transporter [Bryobacterales bacterium]
MHRFVEFALRYKFLVLVLTALLIGMGVNSMYLLPIDAVPDVTPNQVQVLTTSSGLSPLEVEQFITFPVETALSGLPGIESIRSVSRFGLSAVYVYFDDDVDIYLARQLVIERMEQAHDAIPEDYGKPELGPISTGLGEVLQFEVRSDTHSLMELRSILDWDVAFKLRSVPGVVEVNAYGGEAKTYQIQLDADKLASLSISLGQVFEAIENNNANSGGAYIEKNQEQYLVRGEGLVETVEDIRNIVVGATLGGTPIYIGDLGQVVLEPLVRQGAVTRDGRGEAVTGVVLMLMGENSRIVVERAKQRLEDARRSLPPGVEIDIYYDRTDLVQRTIATVEKNLVEGGLLVVAVLLLLLGNVRGGLIVATAIPLSMLFAFTGMVRAGLSGNLMSLGAIDFGLIVDGSVVMIENIVRKVSARKGTGMSQEQAILEAGREVAKPIVFAVGIIIVVYLPILTLEGVEGKMFRPMALTVIFALVGSLILSLTLMPVLASWVFRKGLKERETRLLRWAKAAYLPTLRAAVDRPSIVVLVALLVFAASLAMIPFLGAEFVPRLGEGSIAVQAWRLPSVSLSESIKSTTLIEKVLLEFPEVDSVVSRTGQAEIPTDPMGVETSDIYVLLKPEEAQKGSGEAAELVARFDDALRERVPGNIFSYSQPIELRVQELIAGIRSELAITLYGDDLGSLRSVGEEIAQATRTVPGAADVKVEQTAGLPFLRIRILREQIARYGINASQVLEVVETIGGRTVGQILEGQRRFPLQVRFQPSDRSEVERIKHLPVADSRGRLIPLAELAEISIDEGPAQISRENIQRRITVEANVRGRDLGNFVADVQRSIEENVSLPPGYTIAYGGTFDNLRQASLRLALIVPLALLLIYTLLYTAFHSVRMATIVFLNVPLAASGGIVALYLRDLPFSISAGVGFVALFGVAVLNGVVLVSCLNQMREEGLSPTEAALRGAEIRLRPVLMTALVASLGFVPMALSTTAGAEVQRPLATVVIGGLVTSTLLTLLVLPAIYRWIEERAMGQRTAS